MNKLLTNYSTSLVLLYLSIATLLIFFWVNLLFIPMDEKILTYSILGFILGVSALSIIAKYFYEFKIKQYSTNLPFIKKEVRNVEMISLNRDICTGNIEFIDGEKVFTYFKTFKGTEPDKDILEYKEIPFSYYRLFTRHLTYDEIPTLYLHRPDKLI